LSTGRWPLAASSAGTGGGRRPTTASTCQSRTTSDQLKASMSAPSPESPCARWSAGQTRTQPRPGTRPSHAGRVGFWQARSQRADLTRWSVNLWVPRRERTVSYRIVNGVPFGPGRESNIDARNSPPVWRHSEDTPAADLLDSDAALQHAEVAARELRGDALPRPAELRLHGLDDPKWTWIAWLRAPGRTSPAAAPGCGWTPPRAPSSTSKTRPSRPRNRPDRRLRSVLVRSP
jgi:hypothetical protein